MTCSARAMTDALRVHYGRIPSAAVAARDFNLRNPNTPAISEETARRWIRGLSLPEGERMTVLVRWLGLDMNGIFGDQQTPVFPGRPDQQEVLILLNELNATQLAVLKNLIRVGFLSKTKGQPAFART